MENPMTWGRAERIVQDEYVRWWEDREKMVFGLSLARRITDALRHEGLLIVEADEDGRCDVCGTMRDAAGCPRCVAPDCVSEPPPFVVNERVCAVCGRDNRNGTNDALEVGGHVKHKFMSAGGGYKVDMTDPVR